MEWKKKKKKLINDRTKDEGRRGGKKNISKEIELRINLKFLSGYPRCSVFYRRNLLENSLEKESAVDTSNNDDDDDGDDGDKDKDDDDDKFTVMTLELRNNSYL